MEHAHFYRDWSLKFLGDFPKYDKSLNTYQSINIVLVVFGESSFLTKVAPRLGTSGWTTQIRSAIKPEQDVRTIADVEIINQCERGLTGNSAPSLMIHHYESTRYPAPSEHFRLHPKHSATREHYSSPSDSSNRKPSLTVDGMDLFWTGLKIKHLNTCFLAILLSARHDRLIEMSKINSQVSDQL